MRSCAALALLAAIPAIAVGATIRVPLEQPSIQAGLDAAESGDTVLVSSGTYYEHEIQMKSGVALIAAIAIWPRTVIDAQHQGTVLRCRYCSEQTLVKGFVLTNGLKSGITPYDYQGGGLHLSYSSTVFEDCRFTENEAVIGGGAWIIWDSSPSFLRCEFSVNRTASSGGYSGGGVVVHIGTNVSFTDCVFFANHAHNRGGAVWVYETGLARFEHCTFKANTAYAGSVLYSSRNPIEFDACAIAFNVSVSPFDSCGPTDPVPGFTYCDIYGNDGGDWVGSIADQYGINGNFSADPQFCGGPGGNTCTLQSDSPCAPENNEWGMLIGALPVGCGTEETRAGETSWSALKKLYD